MKPDTDIITIDRFIWFSGELRSVCQIDYRWLDGKLFVCATELEGVNKGPSVSMAHESLRAAVINATHATEKEITFIERWKGTNGEPDELQEVYDSGFGFVNWRAFDSEEFQRIFQS